MAFKTGDPRPDGAGNPKGNKIKRSKEAEEVAERLGVNPFELLLLYAKGDFETLGLPQYTTVSVTKDGEPIDKLTIGAELRQKSAKDACDYLFPKLKSIEHTGQNGADLFSKLLSEINGSK